MDSMSLYEFCTADSRRSILVSSILQTHNQNKTPREDYAHFPLINPKAHENMPTVCKIVAQKPYQGKEDATIKKLKEQDAALRKMGYTTGRPVIWMRGEKGHVVEVAEWIEQKVEAARKDPGVVGLWGAFDNLTENTRLADLPDAKERYTLLPAVSGQIA
jgi:hypothetical protein